VTQRHLLAAADLGRAQVDGLLASAADFKAGRCKDRPLDGLSAALLFEKPSLRTRVSFEVGISELGGHAVYLAGSDVGLGLREPLADIARNLSLWCALIITRTYSHATAEELARHASVPVINALSDREHPCQALGDLLTVSEKCGTVEGTRIAFIGDGNNVCRSLTHLAALSGAEVVLAAPEGYELDGPSVEAASRGGSVTLVRDPAEAAAGADVVYTDVWTSMGQEAEGEERACAFRPYQVNAELLARAKNNCIVMHCLPARRGEEITADVLDGPRSVVLAQAANRLHAQKAIIASLMGQR